METLVYCILPLTFLQSLTSCELKSKWDSGDLEPPKSGRGIGGLTGGSRVDSSILKFLLPLGDA